MLYAKPQGLCSWNYFLEGDGHHASLNFNRLGEQGAITADGIPFKVRKDGMLRRQWTLERSGEQVATARKSSVFTRTFEILTRDDCLRLRAASAFGRSFHIEHSNDVIAIIAPVHAFTRRATIEILAPKIDFAQISFSFWVVALTWRRAARRRARNSSANASG